MGECAKIVLDIFVNMDKNALAQYQLPVYAAVEGPKICFRLLELDGNAYSMQHEQFFCIMMNAMDNRMTLENVEEAWQKHARIQIQQPQSSEGESAKDQAPSNMAMDLPGFLDAFNDLALAKYSPDVCVGNGRSENRFLLREVFRDVVNMAKAPLRRHPTSYLARSDVCSFILSQKPFTTDLFAKYVCGDTSSAPQDRSMNQPDAATWEAAVADNRCMMWADFLAMGSDLQVVPYLMGIDVLKAVMNQVSSAHHRARGGVGPSSEDDESSAAPPRGLHYPQFVEALTLLSLYAAGRLHPRYPDAGGEVTPDRPGSGPQSLKLGTNDDPHGRHHAVGDTRPVGTGEDAACDEEIDVREGGDDAWARGQSEIVVPDVESMRRGGLVSTPGPNITSTNDSSIGHQTIPFDLGALRALFRHIRAAYDERRTRKYDGMRVMSAPSSRSLPEQTVQRSRGPSTARARSTMYASGSEVDGSANHQSAVVDARYVKRELREKEDLQREEADGGMRLEDRQATKRAAVPQEILATITHWVSELQLEMHPQDLHEEGDISKESFHRLLAVPAEVESEAESYVSMGMGQGGGFARLVIIKELQAIPNRAPRDVVPLLELALDQQQTGKFASALETLAQAATLWGQALKSETDSTMQLPPSTKETQGIGGRGAWHLDADHKTVVLLMEASIHQAAGNDAAALTTLLEARASLVSGAVVDVSRKDTLTAVVLSEMGTILYYNGRSAIALNCFRLVLMLRHKLLLHGVLEEDTACRDFEATSPMDLEARQASSSTCVARTALSEAAAALALNNVGVCLATEGEKRSAAEALAIASRVTTATLGIQHPRSAVVARNLALVRGSAGNNGSANCSRHQSRTKAGRCSAVVDSRGPFLTKADFELWASLSSRWWEKGNIKSKPQQLGGIDMPHVIAGGFFFLGKLPSSAGGANVSSEKRRGKRGRGTRSKKSRGKSSGRR